MGKVEVVGLQCTVSIGAHAPELFTLINTGRTKVFQRGKSPFLTRITTKLCHFEMKSIRTWLKEYYQRRNTELYEKRRQFSLAQHCFQPLVAYWYKITVDPPPTCFHLLYTPCINELLFFAEYMKHLLFSTGSLSSATSFYLLWLCSILASL